MARGFCRRNTGFHQQHGGIQFFLIEWRPPGFHALGASDNHAVARAFGDEAALELSDCPEDMEYQLAGRRRRVDFLFQGQERDALFLESFDDIEKFAERAPQSIQANDGESVAGTNVEE